jgi:hypothetical protein
MRKIAYLLAIITLIGSIFLGGTVAFADNYRMYYQIDPAEEITAVSAVISGEVIKGELINSDITLPGYAFCLKIYETENPSSYQNVPLSVGGTSGGGFNTRVENLKPDTEYTYLVEGGVRVIPVSDTPEKLTFRTLDECVSTVMYGDVNGDGAINSTDYALMTRYILGTIAEFPIKGGFEVADVNADGSVNSSDRAFMRKYILGLITIFPADVPQEEWIPYELKEREVAFKVEKNEDGTYTGVVLLTFPSGGYRVTYEDKVNIAIPVAPDKDGASAMYISEKAFVEVWTGGSPTVVTTKQLKYTLGRVDPGIYKFNFRSNGFSKDFLFEISKNDERWIPYQLKENQVSYSLDKNSEGDYVVSVKLEFGHSGYRVSYKDEVKTAIYVDTDADGSRIGFSGDKAVVEKWTGGVLTVMTTKELKYTLGKLAPGTYKFYFSANDYIGKFVFEVEEEEGETWVECQPDRKDISYTIDEYEKGQYQIIFQVNFPSMGYKAEYTDELAVATGVTPLFLKYKLGGSSKYIFEFLGAT